jgi:hypothetical protein
MLFAFSFSVGDVNSLSVCRRQSIRLLCISFDRKRPHSNQRVRGQNRRNLLIVAFALAILALFLRILIPKTDGCAHHGTSIFEKAGKGIGAYEHIAHLPRDLARVCLQCARRRWQT